ncbi:hypothetical protein ACIBG0_40030 [Nocardia sp. NPDC050630]|uniref:hypothetical protein n=1 Tax=Nocardia sp. NPDC050630 TaxID=3364321 RepID=UPI00379D298B
MSAYDHRKQATIALTHIASATDTAREVSYASEATAHALIYLGDQARELVEQLRIGNVIAALGTDGEDGLIDIEDQAAAEVYVRARIGGLVNPDPNGHT